MTGPETDLEKQMTHRVRKHMLTSFGGILGSVVVIGAMGYAGRAADLPKPVVGVGIALAILMIPVIGFVSTFKNLRCPACEGGVGFQVSANFSVLSASSKKCRHCGAKIFPDRSRSVLKILGIAFAIGAILAVIQIVLHRG